MYTNPSTNAIPNDAAMIFFATWTSFIQFARVDEFIVELKAVCAPDENDDKLSVVGAQTRPRTKKIEKLNKKNYLNQLQTDD